MITQHSNYPFEFFKVRLLKLITSAGEASEVLINCGGAGAKSEMPIRAVKFGEGLLYHKRPTNSIFDLDHRGTIWFAREEIVQNNFLKNSI